MRKLTLLFVFLFPLLLRAEPVDREQAIKVAEFFLHALKGKTVSLSATYEIEKDGITAIYAVVAKEGGFVLVSGDDNIEPIIGYSRKSNFIYPIESPEVKWWLQGMAADISSFVKSGKQNPVAKEKWAEFKKGNVKVAKAKVGPLLQTTWNQTGGGTYPFNYYCPPNTPVGCVATATIQVMKYWEYPVHGTGWYGYNEGGYGFLQTDLEQKDLDWSAMPLAGSNQDVALIGYQVGVTLRMDYDPTGSGSYTFNLTYILPNIFGFDQSIDYYQRSSFDAASWIDTLKKQIDAGQPVIYSGHGDAGGHAFVCDGYDDQDYFHFNWGWGGAYDGFYSLTALNPGSYDFTSGQAAVVNIKPANAPSRLLIGTQSGASNGSNIKEIFAVNKQIAYSLASDGKVLRTRNGGMSWNEIKLPFYSFVDFYTLPADTAYIVSSGTIAYTYDAGVSWETFNLPSTSTSWALAQFKNSQEGFIIGIVSDGMDVYTTSDGGNTWSYLTKIGSAGEMPIGKQYKYYGAFVSNKGKFYQFDGNSFTVTDLLNLPADNTVDAQIAFRGDSIFISFSGDVTDFQMKLPSSAWTSLSLAKPASKDLAYDTNGRLYSVENDGTILYSDDNGQTWNSLPNYYRYYPFYCASSGKDGYVYFGSLEQPWLPGMWILGTSYAADVALEGSIERSCIDKSLDFAANVYGIADSIVWYMGEGAEPEIYKGDKISVVYSTGGEKNIKVAAFSKDGVAYDAYSFYLDNGLPAAPDSITGAEFVVLEGKYQYSVEREDNVEYVWVLPSGWNWNSAEHDTNLVYLVPKGALGEVTLKAAYRNGCGMTEYAEKTISVLSGDNNVVYPNPTADYVNIENAENAKVEVYTYSGRLVRTFLSNSYLYRVDLSDLNSGVYVLKVYRPEKDPVVFKVLVNK